MFFLPRPPYSLPPWYKQMEVCGFNGGFKSGWGKSSPYPAFWDGRSLIHDFWVSVWVKCCPKTVSFFPIRNVLETGPYHVHHRDLIVNDTIDMEAP